jgi:hypothetical protein
MKSARQRRVWFGSALTTTRSTFGLAKGGSTSPKTMAKQPPEAQYLETPL